jgi:acetyl-CoA C-acetyltransferase
VLLKGANKQTPSVFLLSSFLRNFSKSAQMASSVPKEVVIVSSVRTPYAAFRSSFSGIPATELGGIAIRAAVERAGLKPEQIDEVYMGQVVQGGGKQAPAKQAALNAGLPVTIPCTALNKACASGMKSIACAAQSISLGHADIFVAGGMESMSRVPFLLHRGDMTYGGMQLHDGVLHDGLTDAFSGVHMGMCGEKCSAENNISKEEQDEYAVRSYALSAEGWKKGVFKNEVIPVTVKERKGEFVVSEDEGPKKVNLEKLPKLKPAFKKEGGTVTAGNASSLDDGAGACVVMSADKAKELGIKPLARIVGYGDAALDPMDFPKAPEAAMKKVLKQCNLSVGDIDMWEINEAFSVVALYNIKAMGLDINKVNINGGAVALGHPIGASGQRIVGHLIHTLKPGQKGMAGICNGGGGAGAMIIEKL